MPFVRVRLARSPRETPRRDPASAAMPLRAGWMRAGWQHGPSGPNHPKDPPPPL